MTTAHRPTFDPARGKQTPLGPAYHQRLLPAHTHLKRRQPGQGGAADNPYPAAVARDLRKELLRAEAAVRARKGALLLGEEKDGEKDKGGRDGDGDGDGKEGGMVEAQEGEEDGGVEAGGEGEGEGEEVKRRQRILEAAHDVDADSDSDSSGGSESEEEDEEDEEAELLRELAKIKAERAAARAVEEKERERREQAEREVDVGRGNPLMDLNVDTAGGKKGGEFGVKRRWDDDVVFRNQGRGQEQRGRRKEFVNDLLRSEFHKRFMSKYVR